MKKKEKSPFLITGIVIIFFIVIAILLIGLNNWVNKPHFEIYSNGIEVDEITACCFDTPPIDNVENKKYCLPEENLEYFEIPCEPLKKEDLTKDWLDAHTKIQKGECIDWEKKMKDGILVCKEEIKKYKFGNYTIETWGK